MGPLRRRRARSPTHWYYGGERQVRGDYDGPIRGYIQPKSTMMGSIMPKSNTDGAGRGSYNANRKTVIGDVINHGKKPYWDPAKSHTTTPRLGPVKRPSRRRSCACCCAPWRPRSPVDADAFRNQYVKFMQTPGSHNDSYASTAHRMFFANLFHKQKKVTDCPDNDAHNVDTIDGLVLPSVAAACAAYQGGLVTLARRLREMPPWRSRRRRARRDRSRRQRRSVGRRHARGDPRRLVGGVASDAMASALGMRVPRQPTMVS